MSRLGQYYRLTKPGIIRGNILAATAGFLFASRGNVDFALGAWLLLGTSLVIAAACVFNNIYDRHIDAKMSRTKKRALVSGEIPVSNAKIFATLLLAAGVWTLLHYVGMGVLLVGIVGFVDYVLIYTPSKSRSHHATLLGGISGATPPVAGYVAVTQSFDVTALLLFLILLAWQMPHFFAIALFRKKEYKKAGVPIHPLVKGDESTKQQILLYTFLFIVTCLLLALHENMSFTFGFVMLGIGAYWLYYGLQKPTSVERWAKGMFGISLLILLTFSVCLSLDFWLP